MAKRRRKGLGSSAAEHNKYGVRAAYSTIAYSSDASRAANAGKCGIALERLLRAAASYGTHMAHTESATTNHNREAAHNLSTATDHYKRACLR